MDETCLVLVEILLHFNFNTPHILFPPESAHLRPEPLNSPITERIIRFDHDLLTYCRDLYWSTGVSLNSQQSNVFLLNKTFSDGTMD